MMRTMVRATLLAVFLLVTGAAAVLAQGTETDPTFTDVDQAVLVGVRSDVTLPADQAADAVVVVQGNGTIEGTTRALVMVDGIVNVESGARVEDLFALGGTLTIEAGAEVEDLAYLDTTLDAAAGTVTNERDIRVDISGTLGWIAAALALVLFALWIGLGIFTLVSGLLLVAFGTSQARRAAWLIGNHPFKVLVAGFLAAVLPWILIVLLSITVVGIPLAFGLLVLWGFAFFLGYLVAGLWIGERIVRSARTKDRPYAAMFIGVLILLLLSWIPFVTLIATWFGLGAVTMAAWRVLRGGGRPAAAPGYGQPYGQPYGYPPPPAYAPPPYAPQPPYTPPTEQWPPQDRWPPQQPPASWPG
jgi:hypothetical protein